MPPTSRLIRQEAAGDVSAGPLDRTALYIPSPFAFLLVLCFISFLNRVIRRYRNRFGMSNPTSPAQVAASDNGKKEDQDCTLPVTTNKPVDMNHCCSSIRFEYDLGPRCHCKETTAEEMFTPRPPAPTIRRHSEQAQLCSSGQQMHHLTYSRRESAPAGTDARIQGDIWIAEDQKTRKGWRRKQWTVVG